MLNLISAKVLVNVLECKLFAVGRNYWYYLETVMIADRAHTVTKSQGGPTQLKEARRVRIRSQSCYLAVLIVLWPVAACSRMVITWRRASH